MTTPDPVAYWLAQLAAAERSADYARKELAAGAGTRGERVNACPITGTAEVHRVERKIVHGDRVVDVRYELEWLHADPEIHVERELVDTTGELGAFLAARYEVGEPCPHQRGVRHARLRQDTPTGVGNSSRVPESTNTPEGPQNGTQGRTGVFQRTREGA